MRGRFPSSRPSWKAVWTKPGGRSTPRCSRHSPTRCGGDGLATVTGLVGAFEGFGEGEPFVRRIGDHTVVDVPLRYEAGDMKARVAFDADEKVAGLFILAPETP